MNTQEHIKQLRDALRALVDVQDGTPFHKYEREWKAAMAEAERLLAIEQPKPKRIPWTKEEIDDLMSVKFVRPPIRQDWEIAAVLVNYDYHNARTPDACRRKWERMEGK